MPARRQFLKSALLLLPSLLYLNQAASARTLPHRFARADGSPSAPKTILVIGDSLSAEYGLPAGTGWVANVATRLREHATGYQIHNSSISGDTTSGGLSRLPEALRRHAPHIVILELGSNDALRGLSLAMTRQNLARMIELSRQAGARVLLAGMQIPPNYGQTYANQFAGLFAELADSHETALIPFLLEGVANDPGLFQEDAMHPNERGQAIMADTIWRYLQPMLTQATG